LSKGSEDSGFDVVPDSAGCAFTPGFFSLPETFSDKTASGILFGLDEWDGLYSNNCSCMQCLNQLDLVNMFSSSDDSMRIVGGSFLFTGVASPTEHNALSKVLRIAIYVYLSLMLEQHFLSDSNVTLKLSKPRPSPINPPFAAHATIDVLPSSSVPKRKPRSSLLNSRIVSFFSKKTESLLQKTAGIAPNLGRTFSLELKPSSSRGLSPRSSQDKVFGRLRRTSLASDSRSPLSKPSQTDTPFASTLKRLEESRDILSSSPNISLAPPSLIVDLAAKETDDSSRRLLANESTGLKSILGWDGGKTQGESMTGTLGFVRQQGFSVLHLRHVPDSSSASLVSSSQLKPPTSIFNPCEKARWITYMYYSRDNRSDKTLGDAIVDLCSAADKPCDKSGCQFKRGQHELRFIHGGLRITIRVEPRDIDVDTSHDDTVEMWETCKTCNAHSRRNRMSDGT
jgi:1-phosphatidylinositol-3-phosphate 5-kinase